MGVSTRTVSAVGTTDYVPKSGTSLSTPLVAGVCAQLLQIHPTWTPMQVRGALIQTASQASSPDNVYGYGVVNAFEAANVESTGISDPRPPGGSALLTQNQPNPFSPGRHGVTSFEYLLDYQDEVSVKIYSVSGRLVRTVETTIYLFPERPRVATWDGRDDGGRRVASGVYFYRLLTSRQALTKKLILLD